MPGSATTPRPARGATTRTRPAAAGRWIRRRFVHAIHASAKRQTPYNWHAVSPTEGFFDVTFPGILNDCQTCHLPGTFDFSATPSAALSSRLLRTVGQGTYTAVVHTLALRHAGHELRQRVLLQRDQRSHHRGGADDPRAVAHRGGMLRLPRLVRCHRAHEGQHRLVLRAAQRGARRQRDLPGLPRHRPDGGHRGRALEEPLSTSESERRSTGKEDIGLRPPSGRGRSAAGGQGCG